MVFLKPLLLASACMLLNPGCRPLEGGDDTTDGGVPIGNNVWTLHQHDCMGNRTDALWCDDSQTCFVGCGTTFDGEGLFTTIDGGDSWAAVITNPPAFFETARVNTISRSADGLLYLGGVLPNAARVVVMDGSGGLKEVFHNGATVDYSFTVGSFRRTQMGWAIAESLTGSGLVYREEDNVDAEGSWTTGYGFWNDSEADDVPAGIQILDMEIYDNGIYGVGSTINQPPMVYTPKWVSGDFDFNIVQLSSGLGAYTGEMWGIDIDADGVTVGGVNQDRDVGMVYSITHDVDQTDASNWTAFDVSTILEGKATWITDVCRTEGTIYAVGRESRKSWGFVLKSTDGGIAFEDITPYDADGKSELTDVSRCQAFPQGVVIVGTNGLFARNF